MGYWSVVLCLALRGKERPIGGINCVIGGGEH